MGKFDELFQTSIKEEVSSVLTEMFAPIEMLKGFEDVNVLTFEQTCDVLGLTEKELENAIISESVPCVKFGKPRSTWRFPKVLIVRLLLGEWKPKSAATPPPDVSDFISKFSN